MAKRREHSRGTQSQRQLRVGEALRHGLAELLAQGHLRDPALRDVSITVTEVRISADLRQATVYVMPLGGLGLDEILAGLGRAAPHLRGRLSRLVRLKFAPELQFEAETSFEQVSRIERLLRNEDADG